MFSSFLFNHLSLSLSNMGFSPSMLNWVCFGYFSCFGVVVMGEDELWVEVGVDRIKILPNKF